MYSFGSFTTFHDDIYSPVLVTYIRSMTSSILETSPKIQRLS